MTIGRVAANLRQFIKFGLVGGSGVVVNQAVFIATKKLFDLAFGLHYYDPFLPIPFTDFNIRYYNVFAFIAFLVANVWNYQLNRKWTFGAVNKVSWLRGFFPFLVTGVGAMLVSQVVMVALLNHNSPVALPTDVFDDSSGLRNRGYWANMFSIIVAMPINFIINKLWTFRSKPKQPVVVEETVPR
ncbi:GtrA family protein [Corynebacterium lizhenjunii]|uniref:GtrA family protein n=1 Tax=Corynebacterium lizhenjunii TaxID=2709394 RepID=A0A7T0PBL2_9CORY|nr:GtrA family protein [Corynebacterium lizhenjunii]